MFQPVVHADVPQDRCHVSHWPCSVVPLCSVLWEVGRLHAVRAVWIFLICPTRLVEKTVVQNGTRDCILAVINLIAKMFRTAAGHVLHVAPSVPRRWWRVPAFDQQRGGVDKQGIWHIPPNDLPHDCRYCIRLPCYISPIAIAIPSDRLLLCHGGAA